MIRLNYLRLQNFRCFADSDISFHPDLTVLVARNGRGKTALLDAIAVALGLFVDTVSGIPQERRIEWQDVRRVREEELGMVSAGTVELHAAGTVDGDDITWGRKRRGDNTNGQTSRKDAKPLTAIADRLRRQISEQLDGATPVALPLVASYGTGRRWDDNRNNVKRPQVKPAHERCLGYESCLSSSSPFGLFTEWYEATFREITESPVTGAQKANRPERLLAAVNHAVDSILEPETGWHGLHWSTEEQLLLLDHPKQGRLPLSYLSDGVRNTVALVADIAHRCARLNPHLGDAAAAETSGIMLIDEIDMHLHPEWQQLILATLRSVFPRLQFIVTTHSPQVLSTVYANQIRVIRFRDGLFEIEEPRFQTRGVESADVLAAIMGVDPVPKVTEAKWLSAYRESIEQGIHEEPSDLELRAKLLNHFGGEHPLILECDRLIRFTQFRRRRGPEGGNHAST